MRKFDIDDGVKIIKQLMLMIGTWPEQSPALTYSMKGFLTMFILTAFTVTTLVKVFCDIADLQSVSFGICVALASFHSIVKHSMLFYHKAQFYKIFSSLKKPILALHENYLNIFLQDKIRLCKIIRPVFLISGLGTGTIIMLCPMFDGKTEQPLPVPFPINMKDKPLLFYYSIYVFQSIFLMLICSSIPCFDGIIFTFIAVAAGQLRVVREKIVCATNFGESATTSLQLQQRDIVIDNILKQCVKHHIAIERYITQIEDTFTIGFLIQLLVSLVITCLILFNFLLLPVKSLDFLRCLSFFIAVIIELAFFCVPANEIILQSEQIRDACYMSEWTECGTSVRRTLFIIMEKCKRPLSLTAAHFVDLSLDTLIAVLKSSFSYFTVLKQVYTDSSTPLK